MVKRNFVQRSGLDRLRIVPARDFGRDHQRTGGGGKRRRVQRLANMANRILPGGVLVQEAAARGEIEQREANHRREVPTQSSLVQV